MPRRHAEEVVIDKQSATDGHLAVGDTTTVLANGPPLRVRIAGIVGFGTADSPAGASVVLFTTPVAQRLVAAPGKFSLDRLRRRPGRVPAAAGGQPAARCCRPAPRR